MYTLVRLSNCVRSVCSEKDAPVRLRNPNVASMKSDILYHLALGSGSHDLEAMFGDVKVSLVPNIDAFFLNPVSRFSIRSMFRPHGRQH